MTRHLAKLSLTLLIAGSAMPSFALQASASASIANISFSVFDLDANDGIQPSFAFVVNAGPIAEAYYPSGSVASAVFPLVVASSTQVFAQIQANSTPSAGSMSSASVNATSLHADAVAAQPGDTRNATAVVSAGQNNGSFQTPIFSRLLLVLSPQTRLEMTFDASASTSLDCSAADQSSNSCSSSAFGYAQFNGAYSLATGQLLSFFGSGYAGATAAGNATQSFSGLQVWLSNTNPEAAIVSLYTSVAANTFLAQTAQVPEPFMWSLFCLGISTLGILRGCRPKSIDEATRS